MAKSAAAGVDVAVVEAHLARYAISCPLCEAVDQLGVGQHPCAIASANGAEDSSLRSSSSAPPAAISCRLRRIA
jgi:hypothetical protein